jgi:hypothetical protein
VEIVCSSLEKVFIDAALVIREGKVTRQAELAGGDSLVKQGPMKKKKRFRFRFDTFCQVKESGM